MAPRQPEEKSTVSERPASPGKPRPPLASGTRIGRYVLIDRVGEGGMGVVYRALDPELDRQVALKLLNGSGDERTRHHRDRLLREAQALAKLQHPNVIAVYDAGTFEEDVFIAMELVDGQTLRRWLGQKRTRREILDAFLAAGQGLVAAHQAGLVHRDFKPENVMVGADGRVRVLDFGLARRADTPRPEAAAAPFPSIAASDETLSRRQAPAVVHETISDEAPAGDSGERSPQRLAIPLTHAGAIVGTPRYMAPEQHEGVATDERADQFSFCVALWHALCGEFPFAGDDEREFLAHTRRGELSEPPVGSTLPRWLRAPLVRGLQARPADRHPSMAALLSSLRADPQELRARRLRLVAALAIPVVLLAGWRVLRYRELRQCVGAADHRLAAAWDASRRHAVQMAFGATGLSYATRAFDTVAQALDGYAHAWSDMHADACEASLTRHEQSQEVLDLRMACLGGRLTQLQTLSDVFAAADGNVVAHSVETVQSLPALAPCADTVALRAPVAPPSDTRARAEVDRLRQDLARLHALGVAKPSEELVRTARADLTAAQALHYAPMEAEAQLQLGELLDGRGDFVGSGKAFHLSWVSALAGNDEAIGAWAATELVRTIGVSQAHYEEGDRWADVAEAVIGRLQNSGYLLGTLYANRAELRKEESRYPDAISDGKHAIDVLTRALGPDHQMVAETYNTLGNIYRDMDKLPEALDCYRHSLDIWLRLGGPDHPRALVSQIGVADVYGDRGDHELALEEYQRVLAALVRVEPESPNVANVHNNMGTELMALGRPRLALEHYRLAADDWRKRIGPSTETVTGLNNLGSASLELGELDAAERYFGDGLAMSEKVLGPTHAFSGLVLQGLADARLRHGKRDQALADYERSIVIIEKALDAKNPHLVDSLTGIGRVYNERHDPARARPPLQRALAIAEASPGDGRELNETRLALAEALRPLGRADEARTLATEAREAFAKFGPRAHRDLAEATAWLHDQH
jgi:eukaryotic-like serine/threonine-protein kinase